MQPRITRGCRGRGSGRTALALAAMLGLLAVAAADGERARLRVVTQIEPGRWELQEQGSSAAPQQMCITDADVLVQYQHRAVQCARFVVEDQPMSATVTYDCRDRGRGRTSIRASTGRAIHIDTQGLVAGAPFEMSFNARWLGACRPRAR